MKKIAWIISIVFVASLAWAQTDKLNPEKKTMEFFPASSLVITNTNGTIYPEIKSGDKVVFQFTRQAAENPMVSDDEMTESLVFEADANWKTFEYRKKILLSKATYQLGCFCAERGYFTVTGGYIKGKKLANGNYLIDANVSITFKNGTKKSFKFKGTFNPVHAG